MIQSHQIEEAITDQVSRHRPGHVAALGVEIQNGSAVLTGMVKTLWARKVAEDIALNMPQIHSVDNRLKIKGEVMPISDEELKSRITEILRLEPGTASPSIRVSVSGGEVTLQGRIDSYPQKVRAEEMASVMEGVVAVRNRLYVESPENIPDADIADDINRALREDISAEAENINVEVENGVVTLSGTVPTWTVYLDAWDTSRHTPGVRSVRNHLVVE
ncbi:MAG: BON domain-containing protein [Dehalococcoidia bacterium]